MASRKRSAEDDSDCLRPEDYTLRSEMPSDISHAGPSYMGYYDISLRTPVTYPDVLDPAAHACILAHETTHNELAAGTLIGLLTGACLRLANNTDSRQAKSKWKAIGALLRDTSIYVHESAATFAKVEALRVDREASEKSVRTYISNLPPFYRRVFDSTENGMRMGHNALRSDITWRRQTSAAEPPASASLTIPIICSSVNRFARMSQPPWSNLTRKIDPSRGGVYWGKVSRRVTPQNKSTQLGVIRNLSYGTFDFLIGVILSPEYSVLYAAQIPHEMVLRLSVYNEHQNGHILQLRKGVLAETGVEDITEKLGVQLHDRCRHVACRASGGRGCNRGMYLLKTLPVRCNGKASSY